MTKSNLFLGWPLCLVLVLQVATARGEEPALPRVDALLVTEDQLRVKAGDVSQERAYLLDVFNTHYVTTLHSLIDTNRHQLDVEAILDVQQRMSVTLHGEDLAYIQAHARDLARNLVTMAFFRKQAPRLSPAQLARVEEDVRDFTQTVEDLVGQALFGEVEAEVLAAAANAARNDALNAARTEGTVAYKARPAERDVNDMLVWIGESLSDTKAYLRLKCEEEHAIRYPRMAIEAGWIEEPPRACAEVYEKEVGRIWSFAMDWLSDQMRDTSVAESMACSSVEDVLYLGDPAQREADRDRVYQALQEYIGRREAEMASQHPPTTPPTPAPAHAADLQN